MINLYSIHTNASALLVGLASTRGVDTIGVPSDQPGSVADWPVNEGSRMRRPEGKKLYNKQFFLTKKNKNYVRLLGCCLRLNRHYN